MAEIWLLCEGDSDTDLLNSVLVKVLAAEIIVEAVGGERNLGAVAGFVKRQRGGTVAYVQDRDYLRRENADESFVDGGPGFIWRRHAIENYLLEPRVVVAAFKQLRESLKDAPPGASVWASALPGEQETVAAALRECAAARAPQEAGRIAVHRLWKDLSGTAGRIQRRVPGLLGEGANPDVSSCRLAMVDEAQRLVTAACEAATSPHLAPASIRARYDAALAEISDPGYVQTMRFLEDFRGKDLLRELCRWLRDRRQVRMSEKQLTKELSKALPDVYRANPSLYGVDDFRDLANGVRALAGLPKLA